MNEQEKLYFSALTKDRAEIADMLERPAVSGIQRSVVEKYTDQAHFIYELLQNADDVGATVADFLLYPDKLVFKHNGTRHFFVTNPSKEKEDTENNTLGDLNAITSVANSNKQKASIGKFGVGFKAVFQYTSTPHIYDPGVRFKIERFIVPIELQDDFPGRKNDETIFVFPFDHPDRDADEAYEDIADKLQNLEYPVLFLKHLKDVSFEIDGVTGLYGKKKLVSKTFGEIIAQKLRLDKNEGDDIVCETLWLFSKKDENDRDYCVGFFVDESSKLIPISMPAFCFFPTKEVTDLNFIIHAPFLLTDSREGIKAGEAYNKELIIALAELAAESLECFKAIGKENGVRIIDDSILNMVPINEDVFPPLNNKSKISFLPFYTKLQTALADGLLPTANGYISSEHAYWSDTIDIINVFSDVQLGQLLGDPEAHWVFRSYGRNTVSHNAREGLQAYIDSLTQDWINEYDISSNISAEFVAKQTEKWLHRLYEWLGTGRRFQYFKTKPIFLDADGKPAAAYNQKGEKVLFLPSVAKIDCPIIKKSLLKNENTKDFILNTVKLEEPSLRDYIDVTIIPKYTNDEAIDPVNDFLSFFKYYCECKHEESASFIDKIKGLKFLNYYSAEDEQTHQDVASELYFPNDKLRSYFETKPSAHFVALSYYEKILGCEEKIPSLHSFLDELGIKREVSIITKDLSQEEAYKLPHKWHLSTWSFRNSWEEKSLDGSEEILDTILAQHNEEKSVLLWDVLASAASGYYSFSDLFSGQHKYYYYSSKTEPYETELAQKIKNEKWLVNSDGEFCSPSDLTPERLASAYDTSDAAAHLISFLGMVQTKNNSYYDYEDDDTDDYLSDEQKADLARGKKLRDAGLDDDEAFDRFLEEYMLRKGNQKSSEKGTKNTYTYLKEDDSSDVVDNTTVTTIVDDIKKRSQQRSKGKKQIVSEPSPSKQADDFSEEDVDDYNPTLIDYQKQIERKKEQSSEEIENIAQMQDLQETVLSTGRYSYLWFKTLLEMEILNSDRDSISSREINISFGKVEREPGKQKTLLLKHPNRYIPQYMEELADIPLVLHMSDSSTKSVAIEVSSVKSYTLRVKLRKDADIEGIDLSAVREATIKAAKPVFLLEKLKEGFTGLGYEDAYSMKENLPSNLEFVFGPPGTGKTTYLANNILIPFMKDNQDLRVLVLTPTNKAADVITSKIMEGMGSDTSYENWLVRFGITASEEIEGSPVYHDKTFDIRQFSRNVTITTIARFPYDFFMPEGERLYLQNLSWDYIVIDEASMIPIVNIIYPIYKKTPKKFIIAGDPFQIEPVTTVDMWADENIYTLVNLKSFVNPETEPMQYKVTSLTTQYRSIPEIGSVFSQFTYGGILQHHRDSSTRRDLHLKELMDIEPLNIIKFPVSKYESIYKAKRLKGTTPYQVYSAIFTMEYVCFLAEKLAENNSGEQFRIGVVAPYKAQASLIDKLMSSTNLPDGIDAQVGTIHGFQGDECDIIMAVLNPPPGISSSDRLFLNKQNILNVAISRARDYLFLIMPDDNTDNVLNLKKVKLIERLMKKSAAFVEYNSPTIEELMFGSSAYIEENSFATSHQTVNVYGQPEMKYEIRSEDSAVDVQIHRNAAYTYTSDIKQVLSAELQLHQAQNSNNQIFTDSPVPEALKSNAIEVDAFGAEAGHYYLVPYKGKLKAFTSAPITGMFIPQERDGKEKLITVSVDEAASIIYISEDSFKSYETGLKSADGFELRKTYFR